MGVGGGGDGKGVGLRTGRRKIRKWGGNFGFWVGEGIRWEMWGASSDTGHWGGVVAGCWEYVFLGGVWRRENGVGLRRKSGVGG